MRHAHRTGIVASCVVLVLATIGASCADAMSEPSSLAIDAVAPTVVVTTAPVGIPLEPTPTAVALPTREATALPMPSPTPVAPPDEPSAPVTPVPEASATPVTTAVVERAAPDQASDNEPEQPADGFSESPAPAEPTESPVPTSTAEPTPTEVAPDQHITVASGYQPLGQAGGVIVYLPVDRIELIGFHEAGHPGSQAINAAGTGVPMVTMDSRSRGTSPTSAADIVVPPGEPVVAPVTGTVIAASTYVLYCQYNDRLVYIEPDGLPGWQVRVFHLEGEAPAVGTRVAAGQTQIGTGARMLPFESQIDELTAEPSWPHVHIEVVDTTVPDTRPPGPGCD